MKHCILMTAALASGGVALGQADDEYNYTTQNGYLNWDGLTTPDDKDVKVGLYNGFTFNISEDSFNNDPPTYRHRDSLTTVTNSHGDPMATEPKEFRTGNLLNLCSLQIIGAGGYEFENIASVQIIMPTGNVSSVNMTVDMRDVYDPWQSSPVTQRNVATFNFEGVNVEIGNTYQVLFFDINNNQVEANIAVSKNGGDNFFMLKEINNIITNTNDDFSAAGLTINTTTITDDEVVPEPSTATLSLLALAGLLGRRRRC